MMLSLQSLCAHRLELVFGQLSKLDNTMLMPFWLE
jgi:hypothetical protein